MNFALVGAFVDRFFFKRGGGAPRERRSALHELLEDGRRWSRASCPHLAIFFTILLVLIDGLSYLRSLVATFGVDLHSGHRIYFVNESTEDVFVCVDAEPGELSARLREMGAAVGEALAEGFQKIAPRTADLVPVAKTSNSSSYSLYVTVVRRKGDLLRSFDCISHPMDRYSTVVFKNGSITVAKNDSLPSGMLSESSVTIARRRSQLEGARFWLLERVDRFCWQRQRKSHRSGVFVCNTTSSTVFARCVLRTMSSEEGEQTLQLQEECSVQPDDFLAGIWSKVTPLGRLLFEPDVQGDKYEEGNTRMCIYVFSFEEEVVYSLETSPETSSVSFPSDFQKGSGSGALRLLEEKRLALHYD